MLTTRKYPGSGSHNQAENSDVAEVTKRALRYLLIGNLCVLGTLILMYLVGR